MYIVSQMENGKFFGEVLETGYYDDRGNYTEEKKSFEKCKKEVYATWK